MKNYIIFGLLIFVYSQGIAQQIIRDTITYVPIQKTFLNTIPQDSIIKYSNMRRLMINQKTMVDDRFKYQNLPQSIFMVDRPAVNSKYENFIDPQNRTFIDKTDFFKHSQSDHSIKNLHNNNKIEDFPNSLISKSKQDFFSDLNEEGILSSLIVKTDIVDQLDSINKLSYKSLKYNRSTEEIINSSTKQISFTQHQRLLDRLNFEILVGLVDQPLQVDYLSPALGYLLTKRTTIGAGPNLLLNKAHMHQSSKMGLRSFLRQDLYKGKLYLQLEDASHINRDRVIEFNNDNHRKINHSISTGTGYMMGFGKYLDLNFALFYNFIDNANLTDQRSPFSLRMGLTSK